MKIKDYSILIVEDEFIATEYLYQILDSFGVETIFKAKNSNEALISRVFEPYFTTKHKLHISELPDSDAGVVPDTFAMRFSRV